MFTNVNVTKYAKRIAIAVGSFVALGAAFYIGVLYHAACLYIEVKEYVKEHPDELVNN